MRYDENYMSSITVCPQIGQVSVQNKHEMFKSPRAAQDILRRDMTRHGFNRGLVVGAKLGAAVFIYTLSTQTMNTVRNYVNPLDHAACGFTLGCIYR